jgi:alpha-L-rhamnosidase
MDIRCPRLSWILQSHRCGETQTAYQVLVATTPELLIQDLGDLWNSGKIVSDRQNQVEYAGKPLASRMRCHWKVRIWDKEGKASAWSEPALWTMGLLDAADWQAEWIGMEQHLAPKPPRSRTLDPRPTDIPRLIAAPVYLRKEFAVEKPVRRATLYATALGVYELRLNGKRVGDQILSPQWTSYSKRVQYQTYDVTGLVKQGTNALGAALGNGWYCGLWQHWPYEVRMYGDEPFLRARLEIEREDGRRQSLVSDKSWKGTLEGPIRFAGIYEGETYDAAKEMPGWDLPGFEEKAWQPVKTGANINAGRLVWQRSEPIRASLELKPVNLTEPRPGVYVFDFVQNMAGWTRFRFKGKAGATITLQHGEMLDRDGTVFTGNLHLFNAADRQLDCYTFKGDGLETFEPHFTYHGFRYVEVRGLGEKPALDALTGVVFHSDCPEVGRFTCSNPLLNRLAQNILWSQRANFMGVPTDCPQRDERCGYPGDAQFFMPTAIYNMDIAALFNKCLVDLCQDSANPHNGAFGDHMPVFGAGGYGNVGWGDAGIICPYLYYRAYGDTRLIREHYEPMRRHMEFWIARAGKESENQGGIRSSGGPHDWLNLGAKTKPEVIATAYYAHLADLMAEMAGVIGRSADAERYRKIAAQTRAAFAKAFIAADGSIRESSQTAFALAFTMGLVPRDMKAKMADQFVDEIKKFGDHLATGFIGTPRLLPGLHDAGRDDVAYKLLLTKTKPSWLYPVTVGATTIWEQWDGWDGKNPRGGMNSLNHYAFGSVGEYLFGVVGGIQAQSPGFKRIRIAPVIREGLTWANTSYDSIHGKIATAWKVAGGELTLAVTVPTNTTATVHVPAKDAAGVTEGGKPAGKAEGVKFLCFEGDAAVFEVGAGQYRFKSAIK